MGDKAFSTVVIPSECARCAMTDLRVMVICAGAIVLSAVSGWLIRRFG